MRLPRMTAVVAASLLATAAACSPQASTPEESARQVVESILDKDSEALCDLVALGGKLPDEEEKEECTESLGEDFTNMEDEDRKAMEQYLEDGPKETEEDGDKATVTLEDDEELGFVKIDDEWYWDPLA